MTTIRVHYLDASAIIRLLVDEAGSQPLRDYFAKHSIFVVTDICFAEALGVLKAKHARGEISEDQYFAAGEELIALVRDRNLIVDQAPLLTLANFDAVESLARTHSIDIADAFQLVTLTQGMFSELLDKIPMPMLVTADRALARAAKIEHLPVWDCIHEPPP